jgi:cell division septum initiation protein DivIVA
MTKAEGPSTQEGKKVVRWNAARHGIRSPAPVVPGIEKAEDWEAHGAGVLESLKPEGHLETVLAERVALLSWRLHRVIRYETESIALSQEKLEEKLARKRHSAYGFGSVSGPPHPQDVRVAYESARKTQRLLKKFPTFPDDKQLSAVEADSVLWAVWEQVDEEVELEEVEIPGVPEALNLEALSEYEDVAWTVSSVRAGISVIASHADKDAEELLDAATEEARRNVSRTKHRAQEVEQDLKDMSRERLLPDEKTLEKVARYEAHLSRGLYKAMHELEALQARRQGGSVPLARRDVDGLADS